MRLRKFQILFIDGVPIDYGEITSINGSSYGSEPIRHLTGWIGEPLNPIPINNDFYIGHNAKIILAPIPEPSTLLLFGLCAVVLKRKFNSR